MLRTSLLAVSRSNRIRRLVQANPLTRSVVDRFVAGTTPDDALQVVRQLHDSGLHASLDHLGEDTDDAQRAGAAVRAYQRMLRALHGAGLAGSAEVSLKLSAVGQGLNPDGEKIALDNARRICELASEVGTTVTLDMEDHTTTEATLTTLGDLRVDFPDVGAVLQAYLRRTEGDCRDLAVAGSRVRLCKGAYSEPASVAFRNKHEVDRSYARCLGVLMAGGGYPMIATHDPRMIALSGDLAARHDRAPGSFEYQMLYGIRPDEHRRIAEGGHRLRVYVPYGEQWYGYFARRLAERPANLAFFLRSLASRS